LGRGRRRKNLPHLNPPPPLEGGERERVKRERRKGRGDSPLLFRIFPLPRGKGEEIGGG